MAKGYVNRFENGIVCIAFTPQFTSNLTEFDCQVSLGKQISYWKMLTVVSDLKLILSNETIC